MLCIGGRTKVAFPLLYHIIADVRMLVTDLIKVEQDSAGASEHQDVSLVVDEKEEDATHDLASDTDTADSHSSASGSHSSHSSPTPDPSTQEVPPPPRAQSTIRMTSNTAAHALPAPTAPPPPHREAPLDPWTVYYDCAAGCLEPVKIRQGEPLVCRTCGYRILYKRRTSRICCFEAR
jgi:DNA-directed RNA polymerase subunit RPC12/RpoP